MSDEITVDKCVLVHCYSKAEDAEAYRNAGLAFVNHWNGNVELVACTNGGITGEYSTLTEIGKTWWDSVVSQSRYREKKRCLSRAKKEDFCKKRKTFIHREDFDYIDAASQSTSKVWITNETAWQNPTHRQRIRSEFRVSSLNINEYMAELSAPKVVSAPQEGSLSPQTAPEVPPPCGAEPGVENMGGPQ
jgi:hypothetical protein